MLSKPLERHVASSFLNNLTTINLLYINLSVYCPFHSCETSLLHITDKWLKEMDKSNLTGVVFLDLSKAFDLVNHKLLLSKLGKYHTSDSALKWFASYLTNRIQICSFSGCLSTPLNIDVSVPQCSILEPLLFTVYVNDLPLSLEKAETDMCADDTTIWESGTNCVDIELTLDSELSKVVDWLTLNNMKPNIEKAKYMVISTAQKLHHSPRNSMDLYLNGTKLNKTDEEKLLGVMIDSNLSWNQHIDHLINKLNSRVHLLRRVKSYLMIVCRKLLYNSLIKSILEYYCTVWGNCSKGNLDRLLKLQNRCARIILDANSTVNSVNLFNGLE